MQSNSGRHPTPLFWYLGFHGNAILNLINTPKASTHYGEYSYDVSWSLMKEINFFLNPPFFISMATAAKFILPILLAYLVPLDVDVTGNITAKLCEVCSEFNIFLHLGYHGNGRHFEFVQPPQKLPHTTVDIPTKFHEVWWKESKTKFNPPFFVSMATAEICPTDSDFFGLSHSTRCGCCCYQVSSISVLRVTCYDHFCVFQFF